MKSWNLSKKEIADLVARGAVLGPGVNLPFETVQAGGPAEPKLIEPGVLMILDEKLVILVAIRTVSEINSRDWRGRQRRTKEARKAVRKAVGPHLSPLALFSAAYHSGSALRVVFTRLGGRRMDKMANLGTSMKAVEDAIAYLLGGDDGDPRWRAIAEQEPGSGPVGVRVEIEVLA